MSSLAFVIPGFGGSQLRMRPVVFPKRYLVWVDYANLSFTGPRILGLDDDGTGPTATFPALEPFGPLPPYYGPLRDRLKSLGYTVQVLDFDWRLSLEASAARVAAKIDAAVTAEKQRKGGDPNPPVYVVAHSAGGLVARFAYPLVSAATRALWVRTVFLGCPHGGSYETAAALDLQGRWMEMLAGAEKVRAIVAGWIPRVKTVAGRIVRTWPSVYEMLPLRIGSDFEGLDPQAGRLHQALAYFENTPLTQARLTAADQVQARLNALTSAAHPEQISVVGTGVETITALSPPEQAGSLRPLTFLRTHAGDGVVPEQRARLSGSRPVILEGVEHLDLVRSQTVLEQLGDWLTTLSSSGGDFDAGGDRPPVLPSPLPPVGKPFAAPSFFPAGALVGGGEQRRGDP